MDRLIVKNFGPLKDVDIELNKINLFIGENGSGKSVLGKIITIVLDTFNNAKIDSSQIIQKFEEYYIDFINDETIVQYISDGSKLFSLEKKIIYQELSHEIDDALKLYTLSKETIIDLTVKEKFEEVLNMLSEIENQNSKIKNEKKKIRLEIENVYKNHNEKLEVLKTNVKNTEIAIKKITPQYIPAERNLISLFNKYVTTFITADIPLPKFLLNFSSQYTRARGDIQQLNFLNVEYQLKNGQEYIFYRDKEFLLLEHSSSGIQSAFPLYLTVKYFAQKHKSIIIEEPEQNLFPKAQVETIKYIVEQVSSDNDLFLMTHSPYVLSTLNTLMMAYKAGSLSEEARIEVSKLTKEEQWINPQEFSAYYLENGTARDIKGRTGLISENQIDDISDDMACEFDELLEIYREHKNDK